MVLLYKKFSGKAVTVSHDSAPEIQPFIPISLPLSGLAVS
jgi:hypothetical protein